jgi:2,7-dihydroxy-5-methyl-1-naphthoate 7-O-methyltransferase
MDLWALSDLATPWCIRVAVTLRIAELVDGGTTRIDELAAVTNTDGTMLRRVLDHLALRGVFDRTGDGYALNDLSRGLLEPSARLGLDLNGFGSRLAYIWGGLPDAVRTGEPAHAAVFGRPFWDDLQANPAVAESFDELMGPAGHGVPDPGFAIERGWDAVRTVVDVGGGTGALLTSVLDAHPGTRGILVDLPRTVARARPDERIERRPQSFFDPLPEGADLYLLKSILADWPDVDAVRILRRCAEAAGAHGRVVLLNGVSPEPVADDVMMALLVGGKHRTLPEFEELARTAGLEVTQAGPQASRFVVECRSIY